MPLSGLNSLKFKPKDLLIDANSSINTVIMNFLSIDFSTDKGSLFLKVQNKTFSKLLQNDKLNNDLLMKQILDFFAENNLELDNISSIFVNQGPGNFSGLRGSLAIAKGISLSKKISLFGYDTFIWSCAKFFNLKNSIVSIIKFRDKYFIKHFSKNLISTSKPEKIEENKLIEEYDSQLKVIPKNISINFSKKILALNNIKIIDLDHNELEFLQLKGLLNEDLIKPLYLS